MDFEDFEKSLKSGSPPADLNEQLRVLWYFAKKDWNRAHQIAQDIHSREGSLLHAFLHRDEGDQWNADYWYRQAGQDPFKGSIEEEWQSLLKKFLL